MKTSLHHQMCRFFLVFFPIIASGTITFLVNQTLVYNQQWWWVDGIWLGLLTILNYNIFFITIAALFSLVQNKNYTYEISENQLTKQAVLLFSLKNEEDLNAKILPNVLANYDDLCEVVILSNSTNSAFIEEEKQVLDIVRSMGILATHTPSRPPKHVGIYDFCRTRTDIEYLATCDADTFYPTGSIRKLLCKAHHPNNANVAIFQSHLTADNGKTLFSRLLSIGQNTTAQLYANGFFNAIGQSGYYGSGALIRRADFAEIGKIIEQSNVIELEKIKSHDVWEAAILPKMGKNIFYASDVETIESFPHNYIDMVNRDRRWLKGTIQSVKALRIMPQKNTIATFIVVLFPISMYIIQPLFLLYTALGLGRMFFSEITQPQLQLTITVIILGIIVFQKFLAAKSLTGVADIFVELVFSTLFYLNTPIFTTLNVLTAWMPEEWKVMRKQIQYTSFLEHIRFFWLHELIGASGVILFLRVELSTLVWMLPLFFIYLFSGLFSYLFQFTAVDLTHKMLFLPKKYTTPDSRRYAAPHPLSFVSSSPILK